MTSHARVYPAPRRQLVLRRAVGAAALLALFAASWAVARSLARPQSASPAALVQESVRFTTWDLTLEPSGALAAWQVELAPSGPSVDGVGGAPLVVGIEGGEAAFAEPAQYDASALGAGRLVLGAYSLESAERLPRQAFRAATVHLREVGGGAGDGEGATGTPPLRVRIEVAAGPDGSPIKVDATLVPARPRIDSPDPSASPPQP